MKTLLAATLAALALAAHAPAAPNVLLIYVDDLGYGDLPNFGHPIIQTPALDRLAREGMTLKNYYAPSALCSPSRAGLLTGRHPYRTGLRSWIPANSGVFLRSEEVTLAELLKQNGYSTALIGKWHLNSDLGSDKEPQPNDQGFDYFYGHNAFQIPTNRNPTNIYRNRAPLGMQRGYTADLYADEAIKWLKTIDDESPYFLMLSMAEPHTAIENPPEFSRIYEQYSKGPPLPIPSGLPAIPKDKLIPNGPGEYYANITYMDVQIGRVLEALDKSGRREDTIVVFASDNGPVTSQWINYWEVNSYGDTGGLRGRKHYLYEGGIKVPAIVRHPARTPPGSTSQELVTGWDLFTTLANLCGAAVPTDRPIDGIDLTSVLKGGAAPERTIVWALDSVSELEFVVRRGRWKLFLDRNHKPQELYDLDEDPLELFNLFENEHPKVAELTKAFQTAWSSIQSDPLAPERIIRYQ